MLSIEVIGGSDAESVAARLAGLDSAEQTRIRVRPSSSPTAPNAALVIAARSASDLSPDVELDAVADAVLRADQPLDQQVSQLYRERVAVFASALLSSTMPTSAAVVVPADPQWKVTADRYIARLQTALEVSGESVAPAMLEHIGSTSVPGLGAKPYVDLQMQVPELRHDAEFDAALHRVGFIACVGSRPDSPGVYRDGLVGRITIDSDVLAKRLFVRPDPGHEAILHIRNERSPWARYTVRFRDLLRDDPEERRRYEALKYDLAASHADDADFDDYTRAKGDYFADLLTTL